MKCKYRMINYKLAKYIKQGWLYIIFLCIIDRIAIYYHQSQMVLTKKNFTTQIFLIFLALTVNHCIWLAEGRQTNCLTGYKILTREATQKSMIKQKQYRLSYRCLCPNDYYGEECSYHKDVSCFLKQQQRNGQQSGKVLNIQKNMTLKTNISLKLRCWVRTYKGIQNQINPFVLNQKIDQRLQPIQQQPLPIRQQFQDDIFNDDNYELIELNQYLSEKNIINNFAVQRQFGENVQIIWANSTSIFDQTANIIIDQGQIDINSTNQQQMKSYIQKKMIGDNLQLSKKPFQYKSFFLDNFGFINGDIFYTASILKPSKGVTSVQNIQNSNILVNASSIKEYVNEYETIQKQIQKNKQLLQEIKKKQLQDQLGNISNKDKDPKKFVEDIIAEITKFSSANKDNIKPQQISNNLLPPLSKKQPKYLPIVSIPLQMDVVKAAQYQAIRVQLSILNVYQQSLRHNIGMNSLMIKISLPQQGLNNVGVPKMYDIELSVIQQSGMKNYVQLLILGLVVAVLFLLSRYVYRWYVKLKKAQLIQEQVQGQQFE